MNYSALERLASRYRGIKALMRSSRMKDIEEDCQKEEKQLAEEARMFGFTMSQVHAAAVKQEAPFNACNS